MTSVREKYATAVTDEETLVGSEFAWNEHEYGDPDPWAFWYFREGQPDRAARPGRQPDLT